jgi:hypothetical protein
MAQQYVDIIDEANYRISMARNGRVINAFKGVSEALATTGRPASVDIYTWPQRDRELFREMMSRLVGVCCIRKECTGSCISREAKGNVCLCGETVWTFALVD